MSSTKEISLSDKTLFKLSIGKRVLKRDLFYDKNEDRKIPLFSANVSKTFGYVRKSNIPEFKHDYILWGIDGNFGLTVMGKSMEFATTDHCGSIEVLEDGISPEYLVLLLERKKWELGFDRSLRANLRNVKQIEVPMPIDSAGDFDLATQKRFVERYRPFLEIQKKLEKIRNRIENTIVNLESQYPHVEVQLSTILKPRQGNAYYTRKRVIGNGWAGEVPVYSSNTENNGLLMKMDLAHVKPNDLYYQNCLTWTVDGFLAGKISHRNASNDKNIRSEEFYFTINNHCGILLPTAEGLYLPFIQQILQPMFHEKVKGYGQNKLGTNQIEDIVLKIPVKSSGDFDLEVQKEIAKKYEIIDGLRASAIRELSSLVKCSVVPN